MGTVSTFGSYRRNRVNRLDDSESNWIQIEDDILGEAAYDNSGYSVVSLLADGYKVAIGSPYRSDLSDTVT